MTPSDRVRAIFKRYLDRYPNEHVALVDDVSGNHFRVCLNWISGFYKLELNIDDNLWRFERAAVKAVVEECVRELPR